jgi:hypothetical protein
MQPSGCSKQRASRKMGAAPPEGWLFLVPGERLQAHAAIKSGSVSTSVGILGLSTKVPGKRVAMSIGQAVLGSGFDWL